MIVIGHHIHVIHRPTKTHLFAEGIERASARLLAEFGDNVALVDLLRIGSDGGGEQKPMGFVRSTGFVFERLAQLSDENVELHFTIGRGVAIARAGKFPILTKTLGYECAECRWRLRDLIHRIAILAEIRSFD